MTWDKVKVGDYCEITSSKRIFFSDYVPAGVPFYRSKEIIQKHRLQEINEPLYITQRKYDDILEKFGVPESGDMLLTSVGTIGTPYIVKDNDYFYFKDGNLTWFRKFTDKLLSKFLYYWIQSHDGEGALYSLTIGSSQKALTIVALKGLEIPLPPLPIQRRIADILSAYDDLIENNQKQIKLLEEAAMRLYKEWFVYLRFPGHENTPIVDGVPEGWIRTLLKDYVNVNANSITKQYDRARIQYIDISSVSNGRIENRTDYLRKDAPGRAKRLAKDGDTIWGMVRPNLKSYALVLEPNDSEVFSTGFAILSPQSIPYTYLHCLVTQDDFVGYLVNCTNGAAYPAVKPNHFEEFEALIPKEEILKQFHEITEPLFRNCRKLDAKIILLRQARDKLLPKLMSGEIEV